MELGLNGMPEERPLEAEGWVEDPRLRATEPPNPLFNADWASGRLEKPTRGDKAGGEGQGEGGVDIVSRAIPQRSEGTVHVPHETKGGLSLGMWFASLVRVACLPVLAALMSCLVFPRKRVGQLRRTLCR